MYIYTVIIIYLICLHIAQDSVVVCLQNEIALTCMAASNTSALFTIGMTSQAICIQIMPRSRRNLGMRLKACMCSQLARMAA